MLWGLFPGFFPLLKPASPLEILAHRFVWTLVFMLVIVVVTGQARKLIIIPGRTWITVAAAAVLIALNWGTYIVAVNSHHVADAALGYFINPLVSVLLGVFFLSERLRPLQWLSVGIAVGAVIVLTVDLGHPPVISLALAFSFGNVYLSGEGTHCAVDDSRHCHSHSVAALWVRCPAYFVNVAGNAPVSFPSASDDMGCIRGTRVV